MKRLVIAAFIFGMATGYCGALWQICAQKSLRGAQEMRVSPAEAGSASVGGFAASKVSRLTPLGKGRAWLGEEADRADGVDKKQGDGR